MGSVAEWRSLSSIWVSKQLDRWVGQVPRLYRALRHQSWCTSLAESTMQQHGPSAKGYKEATWALMSLQYAERQGVLNVPLKSRTRQNNTLDPELQKFLEWLSFHWAEYFAEPQNSERQEPSSSSSWSPSQTWWSLSLWNPNWQEWHSHGWQDKEWWHKR